MDVVVLLLACQLPFPIVMCSGNFYNHRILFGRSANFLLEATVERLHYKFEYSDVDVGVLLIRGENIVALGEIVRKLLCLADIRI